MTEHRDTLSQLCSELDDNASENEWDGTDWSLSIQE